MSERLDRTTAAPTASAFDERSVTPPFKARPIPSPQLSGPLDVLRDREWLQLVDYLRLSPREAEITRAILRNQKVSAIAEQLALSPHTVHTYRERLYRKLRVASALELVAAVFSAHVTLSRPPVTKAENGSSGPRPPAR
jgi:DNA-binding CsgD family transcriptional regulator